MSASQTVGDTAGQQTGRTSSAKTRTSRPPRKRRTKAQIAAAKAGAAAAAPSAQIPATVAKINPTPARAKAMASRASTALAAGAPRALVGFIEELPPAGTTWPKAKREAWKHLVGAAVDFYYPEAAPKGA